LQSRSSKSVDELISELSLRAVADDSLLELCQAAIAALPSEAAAVRAGNDRVIMKLVGHVMKASRGGANAKTASQLMTDLLRR